MGNVSKENNRKNYIPAKRPVSAGLVAPPTILI